jgi:hypothetical protein
MSLEGEKTRFSHLSTTTATNTTPTPPYIQGDTLSLLYREKRSPISTGTGRREEFAYLISKGTGKLSTLSLQGEDREEDTLFVPLAATTATTTTVITTTSPYIQGEENLSKRK